MVALLRVSWGGFTADWLGVCWLGVGLGWDSGGFREVSCAMFAGARH